MQYLIFFEIKSNTDIRSPVILLETSNTRKEDKRITTQPVRATTPSLEAQTAAIADEDVTRRSLASGVYFWPTIQTDEPKIYNVIVPAIRATTFPPIQISPLSFSTKIRPALPNTAP